MAEHHATITWSTEAGAADFTRGRYSREHAWTFDGGVSVPASASPSVVPAPWSSPAGVDPEEALVAAASSCHMLAFLYLASKRGFAATSYRDHAVGVMTKGANGVAWVSKITLRPELVWAGDKRPTVAELAELHHEAHHDCFIANSIKSEVVVEGAAE
jgi:organic hydroperoxide reductase OsmC/OhrA